MDESTLNELFGLEAEEGGNEQDFIDFGTFYQQIGDGKNLPQ